MMWDFHGHRTDLSGPADAGERFDEQAESIMSYGGSGQVLWFGPADGSAELRVDVDIDVDRAALRWTTDGRYAVELEPGVPITVLESPDTGLVTVPGELARVTVATARRAVVEYVTAGRRPTSLTWAPTA
ncbi:Imm1 family immunity protein [Plantactinospora mayteni]|uniref:Imm1 family immunity protein n=1 Tax=Plantactinospora mayteni TaxID=566021 RepID=UPI001EF51E26|nr:Imm1 family immunity protein [Plantactinospora mayteni]